MKQRVRVGTTLLIIGTACGLYSCTKEETPTEELNPVVVANDSKISLASGTMNWSDFVNKVENNSIKDPLGQYVAKGTIVPDNGTAERPTRPKYSINERNSLYKDLFLTESGGSIQSANGKGGTTESSGGMTTMASYSYQFYSSINTYPEAQYTDLPDNVGYDPKLTYNPQHYIFDLKVVKDGRGALPGYTIIPTNLNRGAGGQTIYLSYTRGTKNAFDNSVDQESNNRGYRQAGKVMNINAKTQRIGGFANWDSYFVPIFAEGTCTFHCWKEPDLNDGAGGKYIYPYQSKEISADGSGRAIEVGIVSGGSSSIQPPSGWIRVGPDLNDGAGGAYVYFCYSYRND